jgi:Flp pilus assembly protein TadB
MEIGLVAILVGVMVGKAIRRASGGFGGRQQQILAVVLTYFSIATSYIPVIIWDLAHKPKIEAGQTARSGAAAQTATSGTDSSQQTDSGKSMPVGKAILYLLAIGLAAPFLSLTSGVSGIISLFIIFIGLKQAWRLTGRSEILVMGPYQTAGGST